MNIVKEFLASLEIFYILTIIIDCLEFDLQKFEGYEFVPVANTTWICAGPALLCIRSCMSNFLCTALSFHGNSNRCEAVRQGLYGRIRLIPKMNSTIWVKSMAFSFNIESFFLSSSRKVFAVQRRTLCNLHSNKISSAYYSGATIILLQVFTCFLIF